MPGDQVHQVQRGHQFQNPVFDQQRETDCGIASTHEMQQWVVWVSHGYQRNMTYLRPRPIQYFSSARTSLSTGSAVSTPDHSLRSSTSLPFRSMNIEARFGKTLERNAATVSGAVMGDWDTCNSSASIVESAFSSCQLPSASPTPVPPMRRGIFPMTIAPGNVAPEAAIHPR